MHESALARAALPAPTVCLGLLLRPYSLGHELWLNRESCSASAQGLPAAVLICSQTWDQLRERPRFDPFLGLRLGLWRRAIRKMDIARELGRFIKYRADGLLEFPASEIQRPGSGSPGRTPGVPFILRLQQWLMGEPLRLSESAAWDYPVGLAKMRWACHWESEGAYGIKNSAEAQFDEYVAAGRAAKAAKAGAQTGGRN